MSEPIDLGDLIIALRMVPKQSRTRIAGNEHFMLGVVVHDAADELTRMRSMLAIAATYREAMTIAITELEAVEREIAIPSKAAPLLRAATAAFDQEAPLYTREQVDAMIAAAVPDMSDSEAWRKFCELYEHTTGIDAAGGIRFVRSRLGLTKKSKP